MGDSSPVSSSNRSYDARVICHKKQSISYLVASVSKGFSQKTFKCVTTMKQRIQSNAAASEIVVFLVTTAALEVVRRFSRAKCPFVWRALQALQIFSFPPFKWIERWDPFKAFIKHTKKLSRPMFVLSIATVFSDQSTWPTDNSYGSTETSGPDSRSHDEVPGANISEKWLLDLHMELKRQGITLPERLSDDELRRFYDAVNGDFSKLLSSVKKTIKWRQNYKLFTPEELEVWSNLLFWHGCDVSRRPCLIIRLGLACSNLGSNDIRLYTKAVVSQIEHGVVNLVTVDQPQIMVLMDCEGLSPFGFPIQMMRSCAMLLQDYYPNRLGCLIIVRLPRIARVITQALFQVLKPATQQKVRIVGKNYRKFLGECLESVPPFLGGDCSCPKCSNIIGTTQQPEVETNSDLSETDFRETNYAEVERLPPVNTCEDRKQLKRVIAVGILMFCIFILFMLGIHSEKLSNLYWQNSW